MAEKTPYHGFNDYDQGEKPWDHVEDFEHIDGNLARVGPLADRPEGDADTPDGARYIVFDPGSNDHGKIFRWNATTASWDHAEMNLSDLTISSGTIQTEPSNDNDIANRGWVVTYVENNANAEWEIVEGDGTPDTNQYVRIQTEDQS